MVIQQNGGLKSSGKRGVYMNKYEEAFKKIKDACVGFDTVDELIELKKLVEKSTPKKPIKVNDPNFDIRTCPCCGFRVVTHQNYCQGCGQKLRSEEE